jgi:signal transduction histidine kinase
MATVLLFHVDASTDARIFSAGGTACERATDEAALLERVGGSAQPVDCVVIGERAGEAARVAKLLRERDALVAILWLSPEDPGDVPGVRRSTEENLVSALDACVATTRERRLREELERAQGVRDALLSLVAHDIRAPLSVIGGAMSELTHPTVGQLNDEQRMLISLMKRGIERLGRLATNLSYVSKLESGRLELARRHADLCAVVKDAARKMQETEDFGSIQLRLDVPPTAITTEIDTEKMAVVIGNLVSNALRFARKEIVLRVVATDGSASVVVEDDGSGIPEAGDDVFERIRMASKRKGQSGSGLGLAIVRGIAVAHGGSATAENRKVDGKTAGARFVVVLPARAAS